ncbi:MAG: sigma-70 family RNA polymerase sigma factor [Peptostreptococcaceae bacterium]
MKYTDEEIEQVAEDNIRLVHYVIKQLNITNIDNDILEGFANFGYTKALRTFDKNKNVKFNTYAIKCIKNEILYSIRKENNYQKKNISLSTTIKQNNEGREFKVEDTIEDTYITSSLEDNLILEENKEMINRALDFLRDDEKYIITYRYGLDDGIIKTQKEIASQIDMSQANVSKIEKQALIKLKKVLGNYYYME